MRCWPVARQRAPHDAAIHSPYPEGCKRQVVSTQRKNAQPPNSCQQRHGRRALLRVTSGLASQPLHRRSACWIGSTPITERSRGTQIRFAHADIPLRDHVDGTHPQMALRLPNCRYRNVVIQPLAVGTAVPSRIWEVRYEIVIRLRRAVSRRYLVSRLAVQHARQCRNPHQTRHFPPSRSKRRRSETYGCAEAGANDRDIPSGIPSGTGLSAAQNPVFAPNTVLGRIARLERSASSCNGGCETSYRVGNAPWVGCSYSGSEPFTNSVSPTCRDTLSYNTYAQCVETKICLARPQRKSVDLHQPAGWWQVARRKAGRRSQAIGPPLIHASRRLCPEHR